MAHQANSPEVVRFMTVFRKLRDVVDDDPRDLEALAAGDEPLRKLCLAMCEAGEPFFDAEFRPHRHAFVPHVDPKFTEAWRDYKKRYSGSLAGIWWKDTFGEDMLSCGDTVAAKSDEFEQRWNAKAESARERADAVGSALDFADFNASQTWRDFGEEGFAERIKDGLEEWTRLGIETGFKLEDVFRRRSLIPFTMIPVQVSNHYGSSEWLSLYTLLRQAHDAFTFGVHFAAIALARSVLEILLKKHYLAEGEKLGSLIANARDLPKSVNREKLRSLADWQMRFYISISSVGRNRH